MCFTHCLRSVSKNLIETVSKSPKRYFVNTLLALIPLLGMPGFNEPWGKNSDLHHPPPQEETVQLSPLGKAMKSIIWFHQNVISPVDGPRSHFKPSSSNYMMQAINKHGFFKGYIMGCDRLLRENKEPWVYRTALVDGKIWKVDAPE